ncbi:hypothetical protein PMIN04_013047 [Paraphaeosphaeria minitans]
MENEISPAAWPLIHLAAACSEEAYNGVAVSSATPSAALERIKISQHCTSSQSRVTVVAVAGTRGLRDWIVNFKNGASEPVGVLVRSPVKGWIACADNRKGGQRNLCHSGFLKAVKMLISPLALPLSAVEKGSTLLFTGHSAGAAIASLLYAHLKSTNTSPLARCAAGFDIIHCIVFGAPPISTTPLHDDERSSHQGSLFLSLINDGDPIIKADMGYIARKYRWLKPFRPHSLLMRQSRDKRAIESSSGVAAKPGSRLFANSGTLLSMRIESAMAPKISIRITDNQELDEDRVTTWRVHGMKIYRKRIATLLAAGELIDYGCTDEKACSGHTTSRGNAHVEEVMLNGWIGLLLL